MAARRRKLQVARAFDPAVDPYLAIPLAVMRRRDISDAAKLVFSVVVEYAGEPQGSPSLPFGRISKDLGSTDAAIKRALDELVKVGLIERRSEEGVDHDVCTAAYKSLLPES